MNIYKHTLRKYARSASTWVIIALSMGISMFLVGALPYTFLNVNTTTAQDYQITVIATIAGSTAFLASYASIFAGFKAATMYKDEVEDGSFLIMLSKPVSRERIIFYKWLALQTANLLFAFLSSLAFLLGQVMFDNGSDIIKNQGDFVTITDRIFVVSIIIMCVLFVGALIFSSIGLLVSTRTSVGAAIGISIAFGVIIPITSMVGTFARKPEYSYISNEDSVYGNLALEGLYNSFKQTAGAGSIKDVIDVAAGKPVASEFLSEYEKSRPILKDKDLNFSEVGVKTTSKVDAFKGLWIFDINFQFNQMALIASDTFIDTTELNSIMAASGATSAPGFGSFSTVINKNEKFSQHKTYDAKIVEFGKKVGSQIYEINQIRIKVEALIDPLEAMIDANQFPDQKSRDLVIDTHRFLEDFAYQASKPITYLLNKNKIKLPQDIELVDDTSLLQTLQYTDDGETFSPIAFEEENPYDPAVLDGTKMYLPKSEISFYRKAATLLNSDVNALATVKQKQYVSKWTVLSIYIFIALALIPLAYWIVKRQDFR